MAKTLTAILAFSVVFLSAACNRPTATPAMASTASAIPPEAVQQSLAWLDDAERQNAANTAASGEKLGALVTILDCKTSIIEKYNLQHPGTPWAGGSTANSEAATLIGGVPGTERKTRAASCAEDALACAMLFRSTADTKLRDLTVSQDQRIHACESAGMRPSAP